MRMPIDRGAVGEPVLLSKIRRTRPIHEARFNFGTFSVCANCALSLVPGTIHTLCLPDWFGFPSRHCIRTASLKPIFSELQKRFSDSTTRIPWPDFADDFRTLKVAGVIRPPLTETP